MGTSPKGGVHLNQVLLTGRLSKDPELYYSKDGLGITSFHLAVKRNFKNSEGTYEADFIPCVSFRKTAENIASYCDKGSLVALSGRIQTRSYENKDQIRMFVTEVVVDSIEFLQRKKQPSTSIESMDIFRDTEERGKFVDEK